MHAAAVGSGIGLVLTNSSLELKTMRIRSADPELVCRDPHLGLRHHWSLEAGSVQRAVELRTFSFVVFPPVRLTKRCPVRSLGCVAPRVATRCSWLECSFRDCRVQRVAAAVYRMLPSLPLRLPAASSLEPHARSITRILRGQDTSAVSTLSNSMLPEPGLAAASLQKSAQQRAAWGSTVWR
jgi:hypothetical protein